MIPAWIRPMFVFAGLYDLVLGVVLGLGFKPIMSRFGIALPNHDAYVQLPAALVTIFGIGFWLVARAPRERRDFIPLGILMKLSYAGIVLGHAAAGNMPALWTWFAWSDLAFAVAFFAGLGVVFIRSMTAISATIFLVSVSWTLITVKILENITELSLGPAAAFSVLVCVIVFIVIAIIGRLLRVFRAPGAPSVTSMLGG